MKSALNVQVFNYKGQRLDSAKVELIDRNKKSSPLGYNKQFGYYEISVKETGIYTLKASATNLESQSREITIQNGQNEQLFMLGSKGLPFYYRGTTKVPFQPLPDFLGIVIRNIDKIKDQEKQLETITRKQKLSRVKTDENLVRNGLFVYEFAKDTPVAEKSKIQEAIARQEFVYLCTPLLRLLEKNASLLTQTIIVKFKGNISKDEVKTIASQFNLVQLRHIPYAGNAYEFQVPGVPRLEQLDICEKILKTGLAEYAEPNLWHTVQEDAITPSNYLFPEQWDHPLIDTPGAWQVLNDIDASRRFGDPNVIVAIVDSGVNASHLHFNGTVSNGQPKIYQLFDFVNMVANNNSLAGDHGTCCASASIGHTNISSVAGGVPDGTVGVAGNCRMIGIRRTGPEITYSDLYVWACGFNPNSTLAGFPAAINPGADIITNSFGTSIGSPISGLMKDTFDFLTAYGRNGKGVVLMFSAGNNNGPGFCTGGDTTLIRPWGVYNKCHSISASTLNAAGIEAKASYSDFNPFVQFCALSNSNCTGTHNRPNEYGAFTATIQGTGNAPRNREVQKALSAAGTAGTNQITLSNVTGLSVGQALIIENPGVAGAETKNIGAVNAATNSVALDDISIPSNVNDNLFNAHGSGAPVNFGAADYKNNFGGTSYATPVCAGVAALMLSINPNLTWLEVREIIKATAEKLDPNNTNAVGRWRDVNGLISTDAGYAGPFYSQWYGYGRINAADAVQGAVDYAHNRDILVRDNLVDNGHFPSSGSFWSGVDIWVRNANDNASPATYGTHADSVHQSPIFGQQNYLHVRFKNIGGAASYNFFVRAYITHYPGTEFTYPSSFIPTNNPGDPLPTPITPGTYLIGEVMVTTLAAGGVDFVSMPWPANLIPPKTVSVGGMDVHWHPCILVQVAPQDGFIPPGNHVWENNNLAQKNLSIVYPDDSSQEADHVFAGIIGGFERGTKFHGLQINIKWPTPNKSATAYIRFVNEHVERYIHDQIKKKLIKDLKTGTVKEQTVFFLSPKAVIKLQIPNVGPLPILIGTNVKKLAQKDSMIVDVYQFNDSGKPTGGLTFQLSGKGLKPKVRG